jgi:hypothetical protein
LIYGSEGNLIRNVLLENIEFHLEAGPPNIMKVEGGNFDLRSVAANKRDAVISHDIPGLYCQHTDGLQIKNFRMSWGDDLPPYFSNAIECNHFKNLTIEGFEGRQAKPGGENPALRLEDGEGLSILDSTAAPQTGTFLSASHVKGEQVFANNDLHAAKEAFGKGGTSFRMSGNILPGAGGKH